MAHQGPARRGPGRKLFAAGVIRPRASEMAALTDRLRDAARSETDPARAQLIQDAWNTVTMLGFEAGLLREAVLYWMREAGARPSERHAWDWAIGVEA